MGIKVEVHPHDIYRVIREKSNGETETRDFSPNSGDLADANLVWAMADKIEKLYRDMGELYCDIAHYNLRVDEDAELIRKLAKDNMDLQPDSPQRPPKNTSTKTHI